MLVVRRHQSYVGCGVLFIGIIFFVGLIVLFGHYQRVSSEKLDQYLVKNHGEKLNDYGVNDVVIKRDKEGKVSVVARTWLCSGKPKMRHEFHRQCQFDADIEFKGTLYYSGKKWTFRFSNKVMEDGQMGVEDLSALMDSVLTLYFSLLEGEKDFEKVYKLRKNRNSW